MNTLKNEDLKSKIKFAFVEWVKDSTSHGFPKIFKTDRIFLKLMWIFFIICSMAGCSYLVVTAIIDFLNYEVTTLIRVKSEIPINFPAVTICNSNPFVTKQAEKFINNYLQKSLNAELNSSSFFFKDNSTGRYQMSSSHLNLIYALRLNALDKNLNDTIRKSFDFPFEKQLFACFFGATECGLDNFIWNYESFMGNCYTFNSGKNSIGDEISILKQSQSGKYNGLQLQFVYKNQNEQRNYDYTKGYSLKIYNQNSKQNPYIFIDISTKTQTNILLNKVVNKKLEKPFSECEQDLSGYNSDIFKATVNYSGTYSRSLCYLSCYQNYIIKKCNCSDPNLPYLYERPLCLDYEQIYCDFINYIEFFNTKNLLVKECSDYCPLECERTDFDYTISSSQFPTDQHADLLWQIEKLSDPNTTMSLDYIKENALMVNIFFNNMEYTEITEQQKTSLIDLISNIGGILGLFVGISFLSFAELFEILVEIMCIYFEKKEKQIW